MDKRPGWNEIGNRSDTPVVRPARFEEWLSVQFVPYDCVDSVWDRFPPRGEEEPPEFLGTDDEIADLFTYTMLSSGTELSRLTDWQLGNGLDNLLNNHFSEVVFSIRDGAISDEKKIAALESLVVLYRDCLTPRASHVLGHLSEQGRCNPLDRICYMLWGVTPLSYWPEADRAASMYPVIIDVMESALYSDNCAVIESGLHGLGHTVYKFETAAVAAIDHFIDKRGGLVRDELIFYAKQARTGMIL